jgi:uncharacterized glyoxalase superfamily protein PhnB
MKTSAIIPVLRIFDINKVMEFYIDWLGFKIDWQHQFEEGMPLYLQISLNGFKLHLSEHHGDCSPGAKVFIVCTDLRDYHTSLSNKNYRFNMPGLEIEPWNAISMMVTDPFMNRLYFNEYNQ